MELGYSQQNFYKISNIRFHENPSSGSRVVSCGRTDHMTKLISFFFGNFIKVPKKRKRVASFRDFWIVKPTGRATKAKSLKSWWCWGRRRPLKGAYIGEFWRLGEETEVLIPTVATDEKKVISCNKFLPWWGQYAARTSHLPVRLTTTIINRRWQLSGGP